MRVFMGVAATCLLLGILPARCQEAEEAAAAREAAELEARARAAEAEARAREEAEARERAALAAKEAAKLEALLEEMGATNVERGLLQALMQGGEMDPATLLLLMAMMEGGGRGEDIMGMLLFSKLLGAGAKQTAPVTVLEGDTLIIVEDGVVYKLDTGAGAPRLLGSLRYKEKKGGGELLQTLAPLIGQARQRAQQAACISNVKQMCLAALMFAEDWDETLPVPEELAQTPVPPDPGMGKEDWVKAIQPYHRNARILRCPSAQELEVAYAFNRALLGLRLGDIAEPAQTVLFFESDLGGEHPVGGAEALPEEARHPGGIVVGFLDGHVRVMPLEEVREMLARAVE